MSPYRLLGLILLVAGLVCLGIAYQNSESFGDQFKHLVTGDYSDKTVWLTILGAVSSVAGAVVLLVPRRG